MTVQHNTDRCYKKQRFCIIYITLPSYETTSSSHFDSLFETQPHAHPSSTDERNYAHHHNVSLIRTCVRAQNASLVFFCKKIRRYERESDTNTIFIIIGCSDTVILVVFEGHHVQKPKCRVKTYITTLLESSRNQRKHLNRIGYW